MSRRGRLAPPHPAVAAALALAVALGAGCRKAPPAAAPAAGRRILLVGLDAADWLAIDALIAQGRLPTLARLRRQGRAAVMLSTPPLVSPLLWTTIATGRQPEDHGVLDFMRDLPGGGQGPVSSNERRVAALWNTFSAAGRKVAVVGWWASAPAEPVEGTLVSDRLAPQLRRPAAAAEAGLVWPPAALARLSADVVRPETLTRSDLERYVPLSEAEFQRAHAALGGDAGSLYRDRLAHLAAIVAGTRSSAALAERLVREERPDFAAVYLEAVDTTSHLFVREPYGAQAIAAAYADADGLLARLAAIVPPETLVAVVSDHGFQPPGAGLREDPAQLAGPATAWHRPYGIAALAEAGRLTGGGTPAAEPAAAELPRVTPLDVAPTLLHAAGLAVGSEMPGRVALELLPPEAAARAVAKAPTPPRPAAPAEADAGAPDPEAVARLQALGYVGAAPSALGRQNLGESFYRRGRLPAAERELRAVVETQPANLAAQLWLARALADQGRKAEALRAYEAALRLPGGREQALVVAVELALAAGDLERARRFARPGPPGEPGPVERVARALLLQAQARPAEAERELRAALARDPACFDALARLFELLPPTRRGRELPPLAERAAAAAPDAPRVLALLGEARLAQGDAPAAERVLARALALAPDSAALRLDLARAQLGQKRAQAALDVLGPAEDSPERQTLQGVARAALGDWPRAAEHYRQALAARPDDTALLNGLGWALRQQGRLEEAGRLFERSLQLEPSQPEIRALLRASAGS